MQNRETSRGMIVTNDFTTRRDLRTGALVACLLMMLNLQAQHQRSRVNVIARPTNSGSIKLRWAPSDAVSWQLANKYGYSVERVTITKDKQLVKPALKRLTSFPIKPSSPPLWEQVIEEDDFAAVAAQAIFGSSFELTEQEKTSVVKIVNKARELESRFSFALFAADQSVKCAKLSGLFLEDEETAPKEKYLYRVYANIPAEILQVDTGFVYVGLDFHSLPKVQDVRAEFGDRSVVISWNGVVHEKIYNSFWLERSSDNVVFKKVENHPIVNSYSNEKKRARYVYKSDSLPSNDVEYYYRVIGIDAFGEQGPPSEVASGSGKPAFSYAPSIRSHQYVDENGVQIEWDFPEKGLRLVEAFELTRIDPKTKVRSTIVKRLAKDSRTAVDLMPRHTNYYSVLAVDRYGRESYSFPYLVQLEDSIPPSPPQGLQGEIDTLGFVHLSWAGNSDDDLLGYSIHRSNSPSEEFIQLQGGLVERTTYVDTISINNLSEKIYYRIGALDKRFNPSRLSAILELKKPDKIPPVPPVVRSIENDSSGITIAWVNSGSDDVARHQLYRKTEEESLWSLIHESDLSDSVSRFCDVNVEHRVLYAYTMIALDDDGLESKPSTPVYMRRIERDACLPVTEIFCAVNPVTKKISLGWKYPEKQSQSFILYKSTNAGPFEQFSFIGGNKRNFTDTYLRESEDLKYCIQVKSKSGDLSRLSKVISAREE